METEREYLCERGVNSLYSESTGDYTLPDYNTDVKRVIMTRAEALGAGCFVNGDDLEMTGVVNYEVIYLDADNELTSCSFSTDYAMAVKCHGDMNVGNEVNTRVGSYSVRLTGPRRFSVKAQLVSDVNITERDSLTVLGNTFDEGEPEMKCGKIKIAHRAYSGTQEREYVEQLATVDGVIADDLTVIYSDAIPSVGATYKEGGALLDGIIKVRSLIMRDGELPELYTKDISFSEEVAIEGIGADMDISPDVKITSLKVSVDPTDDGVVILANPIVEYSASAIGNTEHSVILDCYLTDRAVINDYEDLSYREHLSAFRFCDNIEQSVTKTEAPAENIREILLPAASLKIEEITGSGENAKIKGIIRFSGVACEINEAGELGFASFKYDLPFEKNVNSSCHLPDGARFTCKGGVTDCAVRVTAETVELMAHVDFTVFACKEGRILRLSSSSCADEPYPECGAVVVVYYPDSSETLFDVGRKFHTKTLGIAADNSLTEEVFAAEGASLSSLGVKKLIIR